MERGEAWVVRHGGREYITSDEMARIFRSQAEQAIRTGEPTLVVLRHTKGVELVLVTDESSFTVGRRHAQAVDVGRRREVLH